MGCGPSSEKLEDNRSKDHVVRRRQSRRSKSGNSTDSLTNHDTPSSTTDRAGSNERTNETNGGEVRSGTACNNLSTSRRPSQGPAVETVHHGAEHPQSSASHDETQKTGGDPVERERNHAEELGNLGAVVPSHPQHSRADRTFTRSTSELQEQKVPSPTRQRSHASIHGPSSEDNCYKQHSDCSPAPREKKVALQTDISRDELQGTAECQILPRSPRDSSSTPVRTTRSTIITAEPLIPSHVTQITVDSDSQILQRGVQRRREKREQLAEQRRAAAAALHQVSTSTSEEVHDSQEGAVTESVTVSVEPTSEHGAPGGTICDTPTMGHIAATEGRPLKQSDRPVVDQRETVVSATKTAVPQTQERLTPWDHGAMVVERETATHHALLNQAFSHTSRNTSPQETAYTVTATSSATAFHTEWEIPAAGTVETPDTYSMAEEELNLKSNASVTVAQGLLVEGAVSEADTDSLLEKESFALVSVTAREKARGASMESGRGTQTNKTEVAAVCPSPLVRLPSLALEEPTTNEPVPCMVGMAGAMVTCAVREEALSAAHGWEDPLINGPLPYHVSSAHDIAGRGEADGTILACPVVRHYEEEQSPLMRFLGYAAIPDVGSLMNCVSSPYHERRIYISGVVESTPAAPHVHIPEVITVDDDAAVRDIHSGSPGLSVATSLTEVGTFSAKHLGQSAAEAHSVTNEEVPPDAEHQDNSSWRTKGIPRSYLEWDNCLSHRETGAFPDVAPLTPLQSSGEGLKETSESCPSPSAQDEHLRQKQMATWEDEEKPMCCIAAPCSDGTWNPHIYVTFQSSIKGNVNEAPSATTENAAAGAPSQGRSTTQETSGTTCTKRPGTRQRQHQLARGVVLTKLCPLTTGLSSKSRPICSSQDHRRKQEITSKESVSSSRVTASSKRKASPQSSNRPFGTRSASNVRRGVTVRPSKKLWSMQKVRKYRLARIRLHAPPTRRVRQGVGDHSTFGPSGRRCRPPQHVILPGRSERGRWTGTGGSFVLPSAVARETRFDLAPHIKSLAARGHFSNCRSHPRRAARQDCKKRLRVHVWTPPHYFPRRLSTPAGIRGTCTDLRPDREAMQMMPHLPAHMVYHPPQAPPLSSRRNAPNPRGSRLWHPPAAEVVHEPIKELVPRSRLESNQLSRMPCSHNVKPYGWQRWHDGSSDPNDSRRHSYTYPQGRIASSLSRQRRFSDSNAHAPSEDSRSRRRMTPPNCPSASPPSTSSRPQTRLSWSLPLRYNAVTPTYHRENAVVRVSTTGRDPRVHCGREADADIPVFNVKAAAVRPPARSATAQDHHVCMCKRFSKKSRRSPYFMGCTCPKRRDAAYSQTHTLSLEERSADGFELRINRELLYNFAVLNQCLL